MNRWVLDASVLIKLHIQEPDSEAAAAVLRNASAILAPELIWAETANIVWKCVRRGDFSADDGRAVLADIRRMPLQIIATEAVIDRAFEVAVETDRSVYDSLYLAAAEHAQAVLLTADQRLANSLSGHALKNFVKVLATA
jgi:predicted nucleic acid-binding protein